MKPNRPAALALLVALALPPALAQKSGGDALAAGLEAYQAKDFLGATVRLEPLAEAGNAPAQVLVGNILARGLALSPEAQGIVPEEDLKRGLAFVKSASAQGYPDGTRVLADFYREGLGVPGDGVRALKLYLEAWDNPKTPLGICRLLSEANEAKWADQNPKTDPLHYAELVSILEQGGWPTGSWAWWKRGALLYPAFYTNEALRAGSAAVDQVAWLLELAAGLKGDRWVDDAKAELAILTLRNPSRDGSQRLPSLPEALGNILSGTAAGNPAALFAQGLYHRSRGEKDLAHDFFLRASNRKEMRADLVLADELPPALGAEVRRELARAGCAEAARVALKFDTSAPSSITAAGRTYMGGLVAHGPRAEALLRLALERGDPAAGAYLAQVLVDPPLGATPPSDGRIAEASALLKEALDREIPAAAVALANWVAVPNQVHSNALGKDIEPAKEAAIAILQPLVLPDLRRFHALEGELEPHSPRALVPLEDLPNFEMGWALFRLYWTSGRPFKAFDIHRELSDALGPYLMFSPESLESGRYYAHFLRASRSLARDLTESEVQAAYLAGNDNALLLQALTTRHSRESLGAKQLARLKELASSSNPRACKILVDFLRTRLLEGVAPEQLGFVSEEDVQRKILDLLEILASKGTPSSMVALFQLADSPGEAHRLTKFVDLVEQNSELEPADYHFLRSRLAKAGLLDADVLLECRAGMLAGHPRLASLIDWNLDESMEPDALLAFTLPARNARQLFVGEFFNDTELDPGRGWERLVQAMDGAQHVGLLAEARESIDIWAERGNPYARFLAARTRGLANPLLHDPQGALVRATRIAKDNTYTVLERDFLLDELEGLCPQNAADYKVLREGLVAEFADIVKSFRAAGQMGDALVAGLVFAPQVFPDSPGALPVFVESVMQLDQLANQLAIAAVLKFDPRFEVKQVILRPCRAQAMLGSKRWNRIVDAPQNAARQIILKDEGEYRTNVWFTGGRYQDRQVTSTVVDIERHEIDHWNEWNSEIQSASNTAHEIQSMIDGLIGDYNAVRGQLNKYNFKLSEFKQGISTMEQAYYAAKSYEQDLRLQGPPEKTVVTHEFEREIERTATDYVISYAGTITLVGRAVNFFPDGSPWLQTKVHAQLPWEGGNYTKEYQSENVTFDELRPRFEKEMASAMGSRLGRAYEIEAAPQLNFYVLPEARREMVAWWLNNKAPQRLSQAVRDRQEQALNYYFEKSPGNGVFDYAPELINLERVMPGVPRWVVEGAR